MTRAHASRPMDLHACRAALERAGVSFAPGLSDTEARRAEKKFGFVFPDDLRAFLASGLPWGEPFPNWRAIDDPALLQAMNRPFEGMWFDVRQNSIWLADWGPRPSNEDEAFSRLRALVDNAPKLIPIRGHRYMPDRPASAGNPVISVHQTDLIYYGTTLENYFHNEYHHVFGTPAYNLQGEARCIDFWSSLIE